MQTLWLRGHSPWQRCVRGSLDCEFRQGAVLQGGLLLLGAGSEDSKSGMSFAKTGALLGQDLALYGPDGA